MRHRTYQQRQHSSSSSSSSSTQIQIPTVPDDADIAGGITPHDQKQMMVDDNHHLQKMQSQPQHKFVSDMDFPIAGSVPVLNGVAKESWLEGDHKSLESAECGGIGMRSQKANASRNDSPTSQLRSTLVLMGVNISHLSRKTQFIVCAIGVFGFSLVYGYLQELISVTLCNRQLGLFLAMVQFTGYTFLSSLMNAYISPRNPRNFAVNHKAISDSSNNATMKKVPMKYYLFLSSLRAIDAACTSMAMAYINYPAKTLMKSSRVVFTMVFGSLFGRKTYTLLDYLICTLMVSGLVIFMHADANSSAVFQPLGVVMLTVSMLCDGAVSNLSEQLMNQYDVGQDEFIFHLFSITTIGILAAATLKGDLVTGIAFLKSPGTLDEVNNNVATSGSWTVNGKIFAIILYSTVGFFGSSCSAAITKEFGALTMSITSTARKATTLFLSFALFNHDCTIEHIGGIVLFTIALVAKSLKTSGTHKSSNFGNFRCGFKKKPTSYDTLIQFGSDDSNDVGRMKRRKRRRFVKLIESV